MSEQPSEYGSERPTPPEDGTVRVREQTANDIGSEDAFDHDDASLPGEGESA